MSVAIDVVGFKINPVELDVEPEFLDGAALVLILGVVEEGGFGDGPFVGSELKKVGAAVVHLVAFSGVDGFVFVADGDVFWWSCSRRYCGPQ